MTEPFCIDALGRKIEWLACGKCGVFGPHEGIRCAKCSRILTLDDYAAQILKPMVQKMVNLLPTRANVEPQEPTDDH